MEQTLVIDIGGTNIKYGIVDDSTHKLINVAEEPTEAYKGGQALVTKLIKLIHSFSNIRRIGISTSGQVNRKTGEIIFATDNIPLYTGTKLKCLIEQEFNIPVEVENDVNCAAIGEAKFGAAKGIENFLCITYGTGIGGAIVINGQLFTGSLGSAGELGHFVTHKDGLPCTCGMNGCYEAYASTTALMRMVKEIYGQLLNGRQIFERHNANDPNIKKVVDLWINEVAIGLAGLVHIFNPECIVLGGGIMQEPYILAHLNEKVKKHVMSSFRQVSLLPAALGNTAGLMGAYCIAKENA